MGKVDIVHVPYKGGGPAMADLMAGHGRPLFRRPLDGAAARQGGQDARARPDLGGRARPRRPTSRPSPKSGLPGYEAAISYGIFLPAGASPALVDRLHAAVDATIRSPEIAQKFTDLGADPQFGTPAEFAAYVADDYAKWARLAKEAGLKVD